MFVLNDDVIYDVTV